LDLVVVADISAATDRSRLELGRAVVESLATHLGAGDRVAMVTSDLSVRGVGEEPALGEASRARLEGLLEGLARVPSGGATDLGAALAEASELLEGEGRGAVVYVGDGAPTVGELEAAGLLQSLERLPRRPRLYAVGVGSDANLDLLETLVRGGGLAVRVEDRSEAAEAALRILAHAGRPLAQQVEVELGAGIENVFPRGRVDVVLGDVLPVVGRVRGAVPTKVVVRGRRGGEPFAVELAVETVTLSEVEGQTDLRLRWAGERLRQLTFEGEGREAVAELGTRCGLITPFTSYYVPSARELRESGELSDAGSPAMTGWAARALARATPPLLAPLALAGCGLVREAQDRSAPVAVAPSPPAQEATEVPADRVADLRAESNEEAERQNIGGHAGEEGQMGQPEAPAGSPAASQPVLMPPATVAAPTVPAAEAAAPAPMEQEARRREASAEATVTGLLGPSSGASGAPADAFRTSDGESDDSLERLGGGDAPAHAVARDQAFGRGAMRGLGDLAQGGNIRADNGIDGADESSWSDEDVSGGRVARAKRMPSKAGMGWSGNQDFFYTTTTTVVTTTSSWTQTVHRPRRCSDAAGVSLSDRQALWEERLGREDSVAGWVRVYRDAVGKCEAPTWRDRQALLGLMLARAGSVDRMIALYQAMGGAGAGAFLRSAILRRVRTPEELRAVRDAFGLSGAMDWTLIEQVLARAPDEAARLRLLRELCAQYPGNAELKLRLLGGLERAGRLPEARRLASLLRNDPMSDAGVRTAVGEMYLRLGEEPEARRVFSEIVEFAPHDAAARRRLGDLYRAHGWHEEAYRQYQTLAAIRPDDRSVDLLLAQAAAGAGRVDEAIRLEQSLAETAEPGAAGGLARVAVLWTSVRLAKLRREAREAGDEERLRALMARVRRSGALRGAGALRVALTWSHPDAGLSLWAGHPGLGLTRPADIAPEYGIEVFEVTEQEGGVYRLEVRRSGGDLRTPITAELVVLWNEGQADEQVIVVPLRFEGETRTLAWTIEARALNEAQPVGSTREVR
jgi:Ca-activated chloride channel family protein